METTAAAAAAAPSMGGGMNGIIWAMIAFMVIMFFLNSRAAKKRDAQQKQLIGGLQKGDKVVLLGGVIGIVDGFKNEIIEVKIAEGSKISVLPSGIVSVYKDAPAGAK